jgi:hypothetical protein
MDLVDRLREAMSPLADEAADEIELLRERVADLQANCGYLESIQTLKIERLTAALKEIDSVAVAHRAGGAHTMQKIARAALCTNKGGET